MRGLHRRHRILRGGRAPGRRHLRHRPGRGAREAAEELRHPGGPGLRRRRGRPVGRRPLLRVGAQARDRRGRGRPAPGFRPGRSGPVRPGRPAPRSRGPSRSSSSGSSGSSTPPTSRPPEGRARARRPRPGGGGRAPRRPGPRPVRDAGGRAVPAGARRAARPAGADPPGGPPHAAGRVRARAGPARPAPATGIPAATTGPTTRVPSPEWDEWEDGAPPGGPRRAATTPEFRPGLEALRLAIHRPEEVGDRLEDVLFSDPVQRAAFVALVESDDLGEAIDAGPRTGAGPAGPAHRRGAPVRARRGGGPAGPGHRPPGAAGR